MDERYLKALADGLKIRNIRDLSIIMGPDELKETLNGLTQKDFDDGKRLITLHTHTSASDGLVDPVNYLENALRFKKQYRYRDLLVAVTDHDTIDALPIILKQVKKNPHKYTGIRLVLGCELSVSYFDEKMRHPIDYEVLHYGINPFDDTYGKWLEAGRKCKSQALKPIFDFFQKRYPDASLSLDEFLSENPKDAKGFGNYILYDVPRYIVNKLNNPDETAFIWDFFRDLIGPHSGLALDGFYHTLDEILQYVQHHQFGFLSLAHPYRILLEGKIAENGIDFLNRFLTYLHQNDVVGMEIFYMNLHQPLSKSFDRMYAGYTPETDTDRWVQTILNFAKNNHMIQTGGSDSHGAFLGGRKRLIVDELTQKMQSYKSLIQSGYRLLNKEVVLGMPAPCMPPISAYENSGIGSSYGDGAKRIHSFFCGMFDKIQLGPMGRTKSQAKHSPYNSDIHPNPFFIPLERLCDDGFISKKTLMDIYDIPKHNQKIDFNLVEQIYHQALTEAYKHADTGQSFDDFVSFLTDKYQQTNAVPYIADLPVNMPDDMPHVSKDLFLSGFSLGTPADDFSSEVRNWHFKVLNPTLIFNEKGDLGPAGQVWYDLINQTLKNAKGGLRIDHYIGFVNPFVISDDEHVCGRLYSSDNIPQLSGFVKQDFSDITRKILLQCVQDNGLNVSDVYVEDLGNRPPQLDGVMQECHLGRLLIAQFFNPQYDDHMYHLSHAQQMDVACLDTHDLPSIQTFFEEMPWHKKQEFAVALSRDLRFHYNDDLVQTSQLIRMQWGALLACPAERVHAFFTSWTGQKGRYNQPGNPDKWTLRCDVDFDRLYFENLAIGYAYNPFDAIALAIYARGDAFFKEHECFVQQLRQAEEDILTLAKQL